MSVEFGEWVAAYVMHRRPYRNSSYIIDLFTMKGRVAVVAKSARGPKSRFRGQLEPFTPLCVSWRGQRELKTLTQAEVSAMPIDLVGDALWCGFYLNELILRLLPLEEPYSAVFEHYQQTLNELSNGDPQGPLRRFECVMLAELGYALPLREDLAGDEIESELSYRFVPDRGFMRCADNVDEVFIFSGDVVIALRDNLAVDVTIARAIKRLLRLALAPHIGSKPLASRQLFASQRADLAR